MNKLQVALKAFWKAWKEPEKGKLFLDDGAKKSSEDASHLQLLHTLQRTGRLIDFLKEDIASFDDAQVGAAVRKIHEECAKSLEELITIRPLMDEKEGASIQVARGYDPSKIKVVGKVKGEPPFKGTLVHRGWKAHKRSLPKMTGEHASEVICPAEVEVR